MADAASNPPDSPAFTTSSSSDRREQKRTEAENRQRLTTLRKPIESRIKRLEEQIAKCQAQKTGIDVRLAEPDIYDPSRKKELQTLLVDQAYCTKELEQLETEWVAQQEALDHLS